MQGLALEKERACDGLAQLIRVIRNGSQIQNLDRWVDRALWQVEMDDTLDARSSDQLAEILTDLQALHSSNKPLAGQLARLVDAYRQSQGELTFAETWAARKDALTSQELESELWLEFQYAFKCVADGDLASVEVWVEEVETRFISVWKHYDELPITEDEITTESILGHHFLRDGVEAWLEAIAGLKKLAQVKSLVDSVQQKAELGQRCLVVVQLLEEEIRANRSFCFGRFN